MKHVVDIPESAIEEIAAARIKELEKQVRKLEKELMQARDAVRSDRDVDAFMSAVKEAAKSYLGMVEAEWT